MKPLCVIEGDGIGREVIPAAVAVLEKVIHDLEIHSVEAGWECFLRTGTSVPSETLAMINQCGAALFGAVSSPSHMVKGYRSAVITMRQDLNLFANIRPVKSLPGLSVRDDVDMIIVRENTEGLYSGRERLDGDTAIAERVITRQASMRIARTAMQVLQQNERKKLTIVHKANILPISDGLFRDTVRQVVESTIPSRTHVELEEMLVDLAAYKMQSEPQFFDVIVTTNLFGDILSDSAAYWGGGMGLAPSINLGEHIAMAEPVHGSAPDIAGKGIANPIAAILSAAMLCEYYWNIPDTAKQIRNAVTLFLEQIGSELLNELTTKHITNGILNNLE
jgi:homoisocitrate dehydrogenase